MSPWSPKSAWIELRTDPLRRLPNKYLSFGNLLLWCAQAWQPSSGKNICCRNYAHSIWKTVGSACFGIHHPDLWKCYERPLRSCWDIENASVLVRNFSWQYQVAHSAAVELHRYVFENYICKREEDHGVNPVLAAEWNALKALSAILNFYWVHAALISKFDDLMDFLW